MPPRVLWFIGLSGAGKSTLADALYERLKSRGVIALRLDGDALRTGLNQDLGFSEADRAENLRRAAHVAKLYSTIRPIVLCSFITPRHSDQKLVRDILGEIYTEVYVSTSLAECERRDPKGLYRKARSGEIGNFTGIGAEFQTPEAPHLAIDTENVTIDQAVDRLIAHLEASGCCDD